MSTASDDDGGEDDKTADEAEDEIDVDGTCPNCEEIWRQLVAIRPTAAEDLDLEQPTSPSGHLTVARGVARDRLCGSLMLYHSSDDEDWPDCRHCWKPVKPREACDHPAAHNGFLDKGPCVHADCCTGHCNRCGFSESPVGRSSDGGLSTCDDCYGWHHYGKYACGSPPEYYPAPGQPPHTPYAWYERVRQRLEQVAAEIATGAITNPAYHDDPTCEWLDEESMHCKSCNTSLCYFCMRRHWARHDCRRSPGVSDVVD